MAVILTRQLFLPWRPCLEVGGPGGESVVNIRSGKGLSQTTQPEYSQNVQDSRKTCSDVAPTNQCSLTRWPLRNQMQGGESIWSSIFTQHIQFTIWEHGAFASRVCSFSRSFQESRVQSQSSGLARKRYILYECFTNTALICI